MAHCCHDTAPSGIRQALPDILRLKEFCRTRKIEDLVIDLDSVYQHCEVERAIIKEAIEYKRMFDGLASMSQQRDDALRSGNKSFWVAISAGAFSLLSTVATVGSWNEAAKSNRQAIVAQVESYELQTRLSECERRLALLEKALPQTLMTPPPSASSERELPSESRPPMQDLPTSEVK